MQLDFGPRMKKAIVILVFLMTSLSAKASQIIPPFIRVSQLVHDARWSEKVIELWAMDYEKIRKSDNHLTKERVFALLKSIDLKKIKLAKRDHLATVIDMVGPQQIVFTFESRDSQVKRVSDLLLN